MRKWNFAKDANTWRAEFEETWEWQKLLQAFGRQVVALHLAEHLLLVVVVGLDLLGELDVN